MRICCLKNTISSPKVSLKHSINQTCVYLADFRFPSSCRSVKCFPHTYISGLVKYVQVPRRFGGAGEMKPTRRSLRETSWDDSITRERSQITPWWWCRYIHFISWAMFVHHHLLLWVWSQTIWKSCRFRPHKRWEMIWHMKYKTFTWLTSSHRTPWQVITLLINSFNAMNYISKARLTVKWSQLALNLCEDHPPALLLQFETAIKRWV